MAGSTGTIPLASRTSPPDVSPPDARCKPLARPAIGPAARLSARPEPLDWGHGGASSHSGFPRGAQRAPRHAGAAALARGDRPDHGRAGDLFRARFRAADL